MPIPLVFSVNWNTPRIDSFISHWLHKLVFEMLSPPPIPHTKHGCLVGREKVGASSPKIFRTHKSPSRKLDAGIPPSFLFFWKTVISQMVMATLKMEKIFSPKSYCPMRAPWWLWNNWRMPGVSNTSFVSWYRHTCFASKQQRVCSFCFGGGEGHSSGCPEIPQKYPQVR